ncbi:MAG: hypothetical protein QM755_17845 [Luteolibacter sp.]
MFATKFPPIAFAALLLTTLPNHAQEAKSSAVDSPLERFDPASNAFPGLMRIHGDPHRSLPGGSGQMERLGNQDAWCVTSSSGVVRIEVDSKAKGIQVKDELPILGIWKVSPDGGRIFGARLTADEADNLQTSECFDFQTGRSLWTLGPRIPRPNLRDPASVARALETQGTGIRALAATFSLDGKEVIVLHLEKDEAAVSWRDAETGKETRKIHIPGKVDQTVDSSGCDYIGLTRQAVYVMVPRERHKPEGWIIHPGSETPEKIPLQLEGDSKFAQIDIGGATREWIAVYTETQLELLREESDTLASVHVIALQPPTQEGYTYPKHVRFSPDHSRLLVSTTGKSWLIHITPSSEERVKEFPIGWPSIDFTLDGRYLVTGDAGGIALRNPSTLEREDEEELKRTPLHCCPITDTDYSMNGDFIISNDGKNLILWSKNGEMLAELISPKSKNNGCVWMQSPIIVDRLMKIYAADGFDFLEWDLLQIGSLPKRGDGISPRIEGVPVFQDRKSPNIQPEIMNIAVDTGQQHLLTGARKDFYYWNLDSSDQAVELLVSKMDISTQPRAVYLPDAPPTIMVQNGGQTFALDPLGKEKAVLLNRETFGIDPKHRLFFCLEGHFGNSTITTVPFDVAGKPAEKMEFPPEWFIKGPLAIQDGRWIVISYSSARIPGLAVVDWSKKKVVRNFPTYWVATAASFSPDLSRLLVGSSNRCIYDFDFKKLCEGGE